jgi:hypothetical protein
LLTSKVKVTSYYPVPKCVTWATPLPFTNVPPPATEALGGTSAAATASAVPNKRFRMVRVFIVILLERNRDF